MGHITNAIACIRLGLLENGFILGGRLKIYRKYLHEDFIILGYSNYFLQNIQTINITKLEKTEEENINNKKLDCRIN